MEVESVCTLGIGCVVAACAQHAQDFRRTEQRADLIFVIAQARSSDRTNRLRGRMQSIRGRR